MRAAVTSSPVVTITIIIIPLKQERSETKDALGYNSTPPVALPRHFVKDRDRAFTRISVVGWLHFKVNPQQRKNKK
jgi:hypothetical protein